MKLIKRTYERLHEWYGPQHWWPGDGPFEILVGALLVQRTTWTNAAKAIEGLRSAALLDGDALANADAARIEDLIKPAGFYRAKASRLICLARFVSEHGGMHGLATVPTAELRERLLALEGIGQETADAILLYALERPVSVIDAYAVRLFSRLTQRPERACADWLRRHTVPALQSVARLNEFHALIVEHGKQHCRTVPRCESCCLRRECGYANAEPRAKGMAITTRKAGARSAR